jgi:hypothetical protein
METAVEFEKLRSLIRRESATSMPGSVQLRYETRLTALREKLREEQHPYPLGAILVSVGAIDDRQLNLALASQRNSQKLLGELLVDLGFVTHDALSHALSIQRSCPDEPSLTPRITSA